MTVAPPSQQTAKHNIKAINKQILSLIKKVK